MITYAQWIRDNRKHAGLTGKQLADQVGVHVNTISYWERGIHNPDLYGRGKLAELFGEIPG